MDNQAVPQKKKSKAGLIIGIVLGIVVLIVAGYVVLSMVLFSSVKDSMAINTCKNVCPSSTKEPKPVKEGKNLVKCICGNGSEIEL